MNLPILDQSRKGTFIWCTAREEQTREAAEYTPALGLGVVAFIWELYLLCG